MIDKKGNNWRMEKGSAFEQEVYPLIVKHEALGLWKFKKDRKSFMHILQCSHNTGGMK